MHTKGRIISIMVVGLVAVGLAYVVFRKNAPGRMAAGAADRSAEHTFIRCVNDTGRPQEQALGEAIKAELVGKTYYLSEAGSALELSAETLDMWPRNTAVPVTRIFDVDGDTPPAPDDDLVSVTLRLGEDGETLAADVEVFVFEDHWVSSIHPGDFTLGPEVSLERRTKLLTGLLLTLVLRQ